MRSLKITSGFKSFWGKLAELLGPTTTVIFFLAVAFGVMVVFVGDSQNLAQAQSGQSEDKGYYLDWLVPNEIVFIKATRADFYVKTSRLDKSRVTDVREYLVVIECDKYLALGVKEVGKRFKIKKTNPILGATDRGGSYTLSLILEVESH